MDTEQRLRTILSQVLERPLDEVLALPADTALLGGGLALDSLVGMQLLTAIEQEFGVDVAAEDLNLNSLESIATLTSFLRQQGGA